MSLFCVLGENCSVYDGLSKIAGVAYGGALCDGCGSAARATIAALCYDYFDLSQLIPRSASPTEAKIARPKPESVPPIDVNAFTVRNDLAWTLLLWERHVRLAQRDELRDTSGREGFNVDMACRHLGPRAPVLATLPPVADYHDGLEAPVTEEDGAAGLLRLHALHRRARAFCGLTERVVKLPGECFSCGVPALRREEAGDRVWCGYCKAACAHDEYLTRQTLPVTP